jgi:hypothetical protein
VSLQIDEDIYNLRRLNDNDSRNFNDQIEIQVNQEILEIQVSYSIQHLAASGY